jgi:PTH1 family peptidyl-tRNA hydrolase
MSAVTAFLSFYQLAPAQMLIAHDEVDFDPGIVKLKEHGGHGGHNGLRDIISAIQSKEFYRLRIGVGHPGHKDLVSDYVLRPPSKAEAPLIEQSINDALDIVPSVIQGDFQAAMHALHSQ